MVEHHYVYTGEDLPPRGATHVSIDKSITAIPSELFWEHPNIMELICHIGVKKIQRQAFENCPRLKRLVIPGVEEVEEDAFCACKAIEHVECDRLKIIRRLAFSDCESLNSIDLPSAMIVEEGAFAYCEALIDVTFGKNLESIDENAFSHTCLYQITIPLKNGLFTHDDVFMGSEDLDQVRLIEEAIIHETVEALVLDEWKSDMNEEIESINQTLPSAYARGFEYCIGDENGGEKTRVVRDWIGRVLRKIIYYKVEYYRLLSLAAAALAHVSLNEIVIDSVFSFLELPDHKF